MARSQLPGRFMPRNYTRLVQSFPRDSLVKRISTPLVFLSVRDAIQPRLDSSPATRYSPATPVRMVERGESFIVAQPTEPSAPKASLACGTHLLAGSCSQETPEPRASSMTDPITRLNAALEGRYRVEREIGEGDTRTVARRHPLSAINPCLPFVACILRTLPPHLPIG